jgi:imipenem/basic amino acid-specific outer membrane pore
MIKSKIIGISLIASTHLALFGAIIPEDMGVISGQIRAAYVNQNNAASTATYGTAVGGQLKYETAAWNNLKAGAAVFVSEKIHFASGDADRSELNSDLFDLNGKSYTYLGEGYIDYSANDFSLRIGRQRLSTPFADTDEIRMQPNTHEAAMASYSGIDKTTLTGGFITRWAGYDYSVTDKTHFEKPAQGSQGAAVVGIKNESIENLALQGWYYSIDKMADIGYVQANYGIKLTEDTKLDVAVQYANYSEDRNASAELSGIDGDVYGAMVALNSGMITVGAAYNEVHNENGKTVNLGLGGGPFFTSMWEWTIGWMEDAKAYQFNAALDLKDAGLDGVVLSALYGDFRSAPADTKITETNLVATYQMSEALSGELNYATVRDQHDNAGNNGNDAGYDRFMVRLNYDF